MMLAGGRHSAAVRRVAMRAVEIERKVVLTAGAEQRLAGLAAAVRRRTFTDVYFDSSTHALSSSDAWLRRREAAWELKVPFGRSAGGAECARCGAPNRCAVAGLGTQAAVAAAGRACWCAGEPAARVVPAAGAACLCGACLRAGARAPATDRYRELTEGAEIAGELRRRGFAVAALGGEALREAGLGEVAAIRTDRTSYAFVPRSSSSSSGVAVSVDVDAVAFLGSGGVLSTYRIAEVEIVVALGPEGGSGDLAAASSRDAGAVQQAEAELAAFAAEHGLEAPAGLRGKVLEYLARHRPAHYAQLVECGLVAAKTQAAA
eukprot:TRINITY_DN1975_c0_g1_i5.p2 TRINITY_DN1975_c0_g1~~TRINITY_DN1975_c0_g1_i5.p2  ORF type:complete len:319 (-),score=73.41 TRINITY_DN1975_c0_g1_i5:108-1064(-)